MPNNSNRKEPKRKFALWIRESTLDKVRKLYKTDNCSSQSEFIEKAILFYTGYLSAEENKSYLSNIVTDLGVFDEVMGVLQKHKSFGTVKVKAENTISLPGLTIYPSQRKMYHDRQEIPLTTKEYELLCLLAAN